MAISVQILPTDPPQLEVTTENGIARAPISEAQVESLLTDCLRALILFQAERVKIR